MGRSIVYCDKCGQLLKEDDFRAGKASMADNRNFCGTCRPATSTRSLPALPPPSKISTSRIPRQPANESRRLNALSPLAGTPAPMPEAPPKSNTTRLLVGGVAGAVVIGLIALMMSGPSSRPRAEDPGPSESVVVSHPPPPVDKASSVERQREEAARAACVKAYGVQTARPSDLAAQWRAFEEAAAVGRGSSYADDANRQLEKIRRKFAEDREALDARAHDAMTRDELRAAIGLWEAEARRYDVPEWTRPAAQRLEEVKAEAERRFLVARDAACDAKRRGDEAEARAQRAKVAAWGLAGYPEQVDQALAAVVPDKASPPPGDADRASREREGYVNRWKEMLGPVAAREYGEAVKILEKLLAETKDEQLKKDCARDLENVKLAAAFVPEAAPLLPKVAKGQKLAWTYLEASGALARLDDVVLKVDATRVEVKWEEGSRVIPFGEVGAATLGVLLKGKAAKAAAVACFLEGDPEGAKRAGGDAAASVPEYYGVVGREAAEARARDEKEGRARALFYEAERDFPEASDAAAAVAKYRQLLA